MTNDIDTRDDKVVLSRVLDRALVVKLDAAATETEKLQAEVERLKAHTWQQERAAVSRWLWSSGNGGVAMPIERGEHWPICGKSDDGD